MRLKTNRGMFMTRDQILADLTAYRAARDAILRSQEYQIGTRRLRRADLRDIEATIRNLEIRLTMADKGGRINTGYAVFGGHRG
jgi:ribosomal protein L20